MFHFENYVGSLQTTKKSEKANPDRWKKEMNAFTLVYPPVVLAIHKNSSLPKTGEQFIAILTGVCIQIFKCKSISSQN